MTTMTKSAFADSQGWSRPYVSKLGKQGRLVLTAGGLVDVQATLALIAGTADPSKAAVAERHQRARVEKGVYAHTQPQAAALPAGDEPDYQKARAHREHYLSLLAEDELRQSRGQLVERAAVEAAAFGAARMLRDLLLGLPAQLAGELVAITDPWEMERSLTDSLRRVLADAAGLTSLDAALGEAPPDME